MPEPPPPRRSARSRKRYRSPSFGRPSKKQMLTEDSGPSRVDIATNSREFHNRISDRVPIALDRSRPNSPALESTDTRQNTSQYISARRREKMPVVPYSLSQQASGSDSVTASGCITVHTKVRMPAASTSVLDDPTDGLHGRRASKDARAQEEEPVSPESSCFTPILNAFVSNNVERGEPSSAARNLQPQRGEDHPRDRADIKPLANNAQQVLDTTHPTVHFAEFVMEKTDGGRPFLQTVVNINWPPDVDFETEYTLKIRPRSVLQVSGAPDDWSLATRV